MAKSKTKFNCTKPNAHVHNECSPRPIEKNYLLATLKTGTEMACPLTKNLYAMNVSLLTMFKF